MFPIFPPGDCMYWAALLFNSRSVLNQTIEIQGILEDCVSGTTGGKSLSNIDRSLITTQVEYRKQILLRKN